MDNPASLLQRAERSRRRMAQRSTPQPKNDEDRLRPRIPSGHASYTALMHSHDRMGNRHIARRSDA